MDGASLASEQSLTESGESEDSFVMVEAAGVDSSNEADNAYVYTGPDDGYNDYSSDDEVSIVPNYDMKELLQITSYRSTDDGVYLDGGDDNDDNDSNDSNDGNHVVIVLDPDAVINEVLAKKIDDILSRTSLNAVHESRCIPECGCKVKDSFWENVTYGCVKISVLKYLIEKKYIDFANVSMRRKLLETFADLLNKSGCENVKGQSARIHATTEFFFKILSENMLEEMRSYRGSSYGESLIHSAFYGHHFERKKGYVNRLIDLGVNLCLTRNPPVGDENHSEDLAKQIWRVVNAGYISSENLVGQSPIYLAALEGLPEILKRLLALSGADLHLKSYDYHWYDTEYSSEDRASRYSIRPIVAQVLAGWAAGTKDVEYLKDTAECIRLLIKAGADPMLPILYPTEVFEQLNISDFLEYFGYVYPGSPVAEVFVELNIKLPGRLDPGDVQFKMMKERKDSRSKFRSEMEPYELVFEKYKYVKDPSKTLHLIAELKATIPSIDEVNEKKEYKIYKMSPSRYHCDLFNAANGWRLVPEVKKLFEEKTGYVDTGYVDDE